MPCSSNSFFALLSDRTLKPKILAPVVIARFTSDSVIPPTPELTISTSTSSLPSLSHDVLIASLVPATSDLIIILNLLIFS